MSIERRTMYAYFCICDRCDEEISGGMSFRDAIASKKVHGWKSRKAPSGMWYDLCPDCYKIEQEENANGKAEAASFT